MYKRIVISLLALICLLMVIPVSAEGELLRNGSFDVEQYNLVSSVNGVQFHVPIVWGGVAIVEEGGPTWRNLQPNGFPHTASFVHGGPRSYNISRGWGTFTAYIYQIVPVVPGTPVRGGAFAYMQSHPSAVARVGIDPTGGLNPFADTVIWTESYAKNRWIHLEVSTTTQADFVTLFLFATQADWNNPNDIFWDDAYLTGEARDPEASPAPAADPAVPEDAVAAPPPGSDVLESILSLNVRTGPGLGFERIGQIHPGATYAILGEEGGWYQITFSGQNAWVYGGYVRVTQGTASPAPEVVVNGCVANHTVQRGDTLSQISRTYGVSMDLIAAENSISDYSQISVDQVLCIPGEVAAGGDTTQAASGTALVESFGDNWCNPGQPWGDGRCLFPDNPDAQDHMWRCGWYKAQNLEIDGC